MTRAALEHLLRAASALTNEREFVVRSVWSSWRRGMERLQQLPVSADRIGALRALVRRVLSNTN